MKSKILFTKTKKWERLHDNLIDWQGQRNAYWPACIDNEDAFHISLVWREKSDVATNHDISYAGGKTWLSSYKKIYLIPMSSSNTTSIVRMTKK